MRHSVKINGGTVATTVAIAAPGNPNSNVNG
jgi:hypothetical protein